jgi:hypothetical protein
MPGDGVGGSTQRKASMHPIPRNPTVPNLEIECLIVATKGQAQKLLLYTYLSYANREIRSPRATELYTWYTCLSLQLNPQSHGARVER